MDTGNEDVNQMETNGERKKKRGREIDERSTARLIWFQFSYKSFSVSLRRTEIGKFYAGFFSSFKNKKKIIFLFADRPAGKYIFFLYMIFLSFEIIKLNFNGSKNSFWND